MTDEKPLAVIITNLGPNARHVKYGSLSVLEEVLECGCYKRTQSWASGQASSVTSACDRHFVRRTPPSMPQTQTFFPWWLLIPFFALLGR